jgi:hypothetical protein
VLLILVVVITNHTLTKSEAYDMYSHLQAKIVHPLRQDAFDVLIKDSKANFNEMKIVWSAKQTIYQFALSLLVTAPSFLVFIYFIILILKKAKVDFYLIMFSVLAVISPLLMHFWGWDMHRWNTLTVTTSFLMFYVVFTKNKNQPITTSGYLFSILVFVIFLNAASSIALFNGYYVKQFPFFDHLKYIINLIYGREVFPAVPLK